MSESVRVSLDDVLHAAVRCLHGTKEYYKSEQHFRDNDIVASWAIERIHTIKNEQWARRF